MSLKKQNKGDLVINPTTQRPVRVGSRTWINLVKKGVLEGDFTDNNVLEEKYEELPEDQLEQKIKEINEKLPIGTQAVRGRGKYANKIVKRSKPLSTKEITQYTAKKASKVVVDNIDDLDENNYDDMEKRLEQLIMEEMINTKRSKPIKIKKNISKSDYKSNCENTCEFSEEEFNDSEEEFNSDE